MPACIGTIAASALRLCDCLYFQGFLAGINRLLVCHLIELQPSQRQEKAFHRHAAAARIARKDLIARWREEGKTLPGFRLKTGQLRPELNLLKFESHPWFRELSQNAVKGGMVDHRCGGRHRAALPGTEPAAPIPWDGTAGYASGWTTVLGQRRWTAATWRCPALVGWV